MNAFPLDLADRCVKCGLCLPHCPTYGQTGHEADSPRGRITLLQALATDAVALSPRLEAHLDGCLGCRACEAACPAGVPYGKLIDAGREMMGRRRPAGHRIPALIAAVFTRSLWRALLTRALWVYQRTGMQKLVRSRSLVGRGRIARLERLVPEISLQRIPRRTGTARRGEVLLFDNCISPLAEREVLVAAQRLLAAAGFRVVRPANQGCCGALQQHAGLPQAAARKAQRNLQAFAGPAPILSIATGCTAELRAYGERLGEPGARFASRVQDIHAFLAAEARDLRFRPLPLRVAVHRPCTARHVLKDTGSVDSLLRRIPGLEPVDLQDLPHCCGAAGSHMLTQPDMADRLQAQVLASIARAAPDLIVTSNVGCSLHLGAGLRHAGAALPALRHPLSLLAQQLISD